MFSKPVSRAQQLANEIERSIVERNLLPGDRIATQDELRERTGYGRSTIGETARLLSERGTVEVRPGRGGGLFVASISPVVRLRRTLLTVTEGASTASDAIAVREALEELIAVDAARHRTATDIAELQACMSEMAAHRDDWTAFMAANWSLHERIAAITPNELARGVYVGTIRCVAELEVHAGTEQENDAAEYLASRVAVHAELVDAIASGDLPRTRDAVEAHRGSSVDAASSGSSASGPASADG
ncbi:FCD domain-containing protein [Streptomyces sp. NBC_00006]|uniref:FadR/GntR family transcriptional regulator n=1 Tax=unclassified Streptomyces TaxID=2593676 RepID=UPI00224E28E9|nr:MULTISPECIES: FCD domain-containing protein [unclassified Streptomyces]MCX5535795.1 FCD domain-containing protein [Streptomyces sp. NBC_00006]